MAALSTSSTRMAMTATTIRAASIESFPRVDRDPTLSRVWRRRGDDELEPVDLLDDDRSPVVSGSPSADLRLPQLTLDRHETAAPHDARRADEVDVPTATGCRRTWTTFATANAMKSATEPAIPIASGRDT